ncbi:protein of unknown function [Alteromonas macleodii]|uniref:Uncharacterized protein n=1 Tax=Alteromonas macleodii TaxID=28108 RepID=A0A6T9Y629_ALTMA|nr:protein of unknown function [Alteromonas macleodii]
MPSFGAALWVITLNKAWLDIRGGMLFKLAPIQIITENALCLLQCQEALSSSQQGNSTAQN